MLGRDGGLHREETTAGTPQAQQVNVACFLTVYIYNYNYTCKLTFANMHIHKDIDTHTHTRMYKCAYFT